MTETTTTPRPAIKPGRPKRAKGERGKQHMNGQDIARAERVEEILNLRVAGLSLSAIGKSLDPPISPQRTHQIIGEALASRQREGVDALVELELSRLDALQNAVWPKAISGDVLAVGACLRISERRSLLLGLNAPTQVVASVSAAVTVTEMEEAGREFDRKLQMKFAAQRVN